MSGSTTKIHELMREAKVIGILWSTEDVQAKFPALTDDQAWEILNSIKLDCSLGVTWLTIEMYGEEWIDEHKDEVRPEENNIES